MSKLFRDNFDKFAVYSDALDSYLASEEERQVIDVAKSALEAMTSTYSDYDSLTPYCSAVRGDALLKSISSVPNIPGVRRFLVIAVAFIREATLNNSNRSHSEQVVLTHFLGKSEYAESDPADEFWANYEVDYIRYVLPQILLNKKQAEILYENKNLDSKVREARDGIEEEVARSKLDLQNIQERIEAYKAELSKLASEYNFVGLADGFKQLLKIKGREKRASLTFVALLGVVSAILPVVFVLIVAGAALNGFIPQNWTPAAITKIVAIAGVEVTIIYFFRVTLREYMLIRSQVTNLQLRLTLCTFIEGYSEFSGRIRISEGGSSLNLFEGLIFGPLPEGDISLPATVDGLEQAVKLAQALKK